MELLTYFQTMEVVTSATLNEMSAIYLAHQQREKTAETEHLKRKRQTNKINIMIKQEFIAMSLPYGIKVLRPDNKTILSVYGIEGHLLTHKERIRLTYTGMVCSKPILHPISDLTKLIKHNGEEFIPIDWFRNDGYYIGEDWIIENFKDVENSSFGFIQQLIKWHFDIANLIEKGEAIDVNSLKINPYK